MNYFLYIQTNFMEIWPNYSIFVFTVTKYVYEDVCIIILPEDVDISRLTKLMTSLRNPEITSSLIIRFRLLNSSEFLNCLNNRMFPHRTTSNTNTMKTLFRTVLSTIVLSRFSYFTKLFKCFQFVLNYLLVLNKCHSLLVSVSCNFAIRQKWHRTNQKKFFKITNTSTFHVSIIL